jgi:hypothetical protein
LKIDLNIAADDPTELLETLLERRGAELSLWIVLRVKHQHTDPPYPVGLLRAHCQRPCRCHTSKCAKKIATPHEPPKR